MNARVRRLLALLCVLPGPALAAGGGGALQEPHNDLGNVASLQRGAKYFVNYCSGCHSAKYIRYNRLAEDLELSEDQVVNSLMFAAEKPFETMTVAMPGGDAKRWFGVAPPDLSLTARSRGTAWIYTFLRSFYADPQSPTGVDNLVLAGTAMPHVLAPLQGVQRAVFKEVADHGGATHEVFERFETATAGTLDAAAYDAMVRDLVNFLDYISEPMQLERQRLGIRVLAFLVVFFLLAYLLKKEYWKDVH